LVYLAGWSVPSFRCASKLDVRKEDLSLAARYYLTGKLGGKD
jgi:hypothetical protein